MENINNCHTHVFSNRAVPVHFLPFGLIRLLAKRKVSRWLGRFLNNINPRSNSDIFDRFASFMNIGNYSSQSEIFDFLKGFYPENSKFVVLSMDMTFMGAGRVPQDFAEQLDELAEIKKGHPDRIFPFICVDPRRPGIFDLVREYIEVKGFHGIKLYPPLGYYPFDERLNPIFEYVEQNEIPIISHCSPPVVYFRGKITEDLYVHPKTGERFETWNKQRFACHLTDPRNYEYVLNDFPNLKVCLAHFGGGKEWDKYLSTPWDLSMEKCWYSVIMELIKKYPNVYADVSYTAHDVDLHALLKVILLDAQIRTRVLFGSDFYMVELDRPERPFSVNLRAYLGEDNFRQIAEVNPADFLRHK